MVKSMTGYGQHKEAYGEFEINVEIKTLNSKFFDLNLRIPKLFSHKEIEIRKILNDQLVRGKASVSIEFNRTGVESTNIQFNQPLFKLYYEQLQQLSESVQAPQDDLFRMVMNFPEVTINNNEHASGSEWESLKNVLQIAMEQNSNFRKSEGEALKSELVSYVNSIEENLKKVEEIDPTRVDKIKTRIEQNIGKFLKEEFDQNRLEQEVIYYIEKLDIKEEIVRLNNHLQYFKTIIGGSNVSGKKLGFIGQEMGREINTIGSKANDSDIQILVVNMKEELEKIKEQVLNIL